MQSFSDNIDSLLEERKTAGDALKTRLTDGYVHVTKSLIHASLERRVGEHQPLS